MLNWHEIVNDAFAGPLAVTYCPLCGSGIVVERVVAGTPTLFGVSGRLRRDDLVMYDRATDSLRSRILATAIRGPRTGDRLTIVPSTLTTWASGGGPTSTLWSYCRRRAPAPCAAGTAPTTTSTRSTVTRTSPSSSAGPGPTVGSPTGRWSSGCRSTVPRPRIRSQSSRTPGSSRTASGAGRSSSRPLPTERSSPPTAASTGGPSRSPRPASACSAPAGA
ncbi:hypothetical protein BRC63_03600, partial [Halobacteriales archaeon QH_10_70_21]